MTKKKIAYGAVIVAALLLISVLLLAYNANRILEYELRQSLGKGFSVEDISLGWDGVNARNIRLLRPDNKEAFSVKDLDMRASLLGLLRQERVISHVTLASPALILEVNRNGEIIYPWPSQKKSLAKAGSDKTAAPFLIKKFEIGNGALDYLDSKVTAKPVLIQFKEMDAALSNISIPPDNGVSDFKFRAAVPGKIRKGSVSSTGNINLITKDAKAQLTIRDVDLTILRPYYEKKGDVEVTQGLLSLDAEITVRNNRIITTGKITIRELIFKQSGGSFLGLPLLAVMKLLKDNNDQIVLDFTIEGDLNNPKFKITESLVQKLSLSLARSLGMPIEATGKSAFDIGGSGLKKLFR